MTRTVIGDMIATVIVVDVIKKVLVVAAAEIFLMMAADFRVRLSAQLVVLHQQ